MLPPDFFELPLEKQLRMKVIKNEIDDCDDAEKLKENLKSCAESLMKYQQVAAKLAEKNLLASMKNTFSTIGIEVPKDSDA